MTNMEWYQSDDDGYIGYVSEDTTVFKTLWQKNRPANAVFVHEDTMVCINILDCGFFMSADIARFWGVIPYGSGRT